MNRDSVERHSDLRSRAMERLHENRDQLDSLSSKDMKTLIHDFQVHQIELEIQNEELRESQKQLAKSRNSFAKLYNEAPVAYLTVDKTGIITQANHTFTSMVGKDLGRIRGRSLAEFIVSEDRSLFYGSFRAFFKNPYGKHMDFRLDNNYPEMWVRCVGGKDKNLQLETCEGDDRHLLMALSDISRQVLAEKRLHESEERLRLLSDVTMEGIVIHKKGTVMDLNQALARILGYERKELLGRNILELAVHHEDKDIVRSNIVKEYSEPYVVRAVRKDGEVFFAELEARNFLSGNELLRVAAVRDITRRKLAEDSLKASEKQFRTLFMESPFSIFIHDIDSGEIIDANPTAYSTYGYSSLEELKSGDFWVEPPFSHDEALARIHKAVSEGPQQFEWINRKVTGELVWEHVRLINITINGVQRVLATCLDITDLKRAEEDIKQVNLQLEKAVSQRDMFFSIIAHDLKSPMAGLLASTELLANEPETLSNKEIRDIAGELHKNTRNTWLLLEELLQWALMNQDAMRYDPRPWKLLDLVRASLGAAEDVAGNKQIRITYDIPEDFIVVADKSMISTVFRNLILNAVKFSNRGESISVSAHRQGPFIKASVRDKGIGMDKDLISRVFSLDKSVRQLGTECEKGTGLGLVLCKEFVEKHGGQIWMESEPGKGTKVFFTLPGVS